MVVHAQRKAVATGRDELAHQDIPGGQPGHGHGGGTCKRQGALAVDEPDVYPARVGGIVMHNLVPRFPQQGLFQQGLEHPAVLYLGKGRHVSKRAVSSLPEQQFGDYVAFLQETPSCPPAGAAGGEFRVRIAEAGVSVVEEVLDVPEYYPQGIGGRGNEGLCAREQDAQQKYEVFHVPNMAFNC